jgi:hypothetical protein
MPYKIKQYTLDKARELGVQVFPSDNPKYKIEIYNDDGVFMFYGGSPLYSDYPTYLETDGYMYADERRRLYRLRHRKEIEKVGSRGWWIAELLW